MLELDKNYFGDVMKLLSRIDDKSVNLIVTSPPYNKKSKNRKPHKTDTWSGGNAAISYDGHDDYMPESEYQKWQINVMNECWRVLKDDGSFFYNHKNRTVLKAILTPYEWILKTHFFVKEEIVWNRKMIVEVDKVRFYPKTERLFWLIKSRIQPKFNGEYANFTDIWDILPCQKEKRHNHPAPFPEELVDRCILATTNDGDIVLDPFVGSGTTSFRAKVLNRRFIGIDNSKHYISIADKRIQQEGLSSFNS